MKNLLFLLMYFFAISLISLENQILKNEGKSDKIRSLFERFLSCFYHFLGTEDAKAFESS